MPPTKPAWNATWGKPVVDTYSTFDNYNKRILEPHAKAAADDFLREDLRITIAEMREVLDRFAGQTLDENQWKRLHKASRHLLRMGWPKAPNEMTLREASERSDEHLAKGTTP